MIVLPDYKSIIDPNFGDYTFQNEMFITPFWTRMFCDELVNVFETHLKDRFAIREAAYGTHELSLNDLSRLMFLEYGQHFKDHVIPMVSKEWFIMDLDGMFSPYFLRYAMNTSRELKKHTDLGAFTLCVNLNDDYVENDLTFPRQNFLMRSVPVGHAVIFPSTLTHPHYTTPLESGVRYSFTSFTWPAHWTDTTGYRF